ncbi:MAG: hypothetical protein HY606_00800 [Planctomycetes bacterium]|nr:hypothetical protein [Planctomycetota bacterium]
MGVITQIETATPKYGYTQNEIKNAVERLFDSQIIDDIFENSFIQKRYFSAPLNLLETESNFSERNKLAVRESVEILAQLIKTVQKDLDLTRLKYLLTVNSTSISTPSLEAFLINRFSNINKNVQRIPMWGLGCAGGLAGIIRSCQLCREKNDTALIMDVETCSLAYIKDDKSKSNLIASCLFGDGAACCVVKENGRGLKLLNNKTVFWRETLDMMGWDMVDEGLKVKFSRSIPDFIRNCVREEVELFLSEAAVNRNELAFLLSHPGGTKVIHALEEVFPNVNTSIVWNVLAHYGNMSSVTVMFVLSEYMKKHFRIGDKLLSLVLGPGFSCEMALFESC